MRRSPVALCASVMAAISQVACSRVLEKCGLEQILEALKLLLSPGGERTKFGAGLHLGPLGRVCPASFLPLRKPRFKEGWEPLNIETSLSISSGSLGPGTVLSTVGTCFHPSSLQLCEDCNHSLRESPRAASESPRASSERCQLLESQGLMWTLDIGTECQGVQRREAVTFELRFGERI